MIDLFISLLGKYTFEGFGLILTFIECQLCVSLFAARLTRKRPFFLRIAIAFCECVIASYLLAILNTELPHLSTRIFCYLAISLMNILFLAFCWNDSAEELLITFSRGTAAYQVGNKLYPLIQNLFGINDRKTISLFHEDILSAAGWEWVLFFMFRVGTFWVLYKLFYPKGKLSRDKKTRRNTVLLSVFTVAIINVLTCVIRVYEGESMAMNIAMKISCILFGIFALLAASGIFTQNEKDQEISTLNQLMRQEKTQFENIKANIDVINTKIHDLKHILNRVESKLTEEEVSDLRQAIEFYDSNIKTGNDILDVILCEKNLVCQQKSITLSCMADGKCFQFLSPVQTYTLFGNIIDNAIEAVSRLEDPSERLISLTCGRHGDRVLIEESNYYSGNLTLEEGMPVTTKSAISQHGFGTKSIQYVAEQYGGELSVRAEHGIFSITVGFPA
ncbi:MAG: sensor histidine kinase [Verrucomicrobia bacterium]|nr:sensor histidine kinase [Lachnospiraceae bacterium]MBR4249841.1 sensor histidine kinase [Verrucomicrobiota bacterium]